jgi:phage tail-like protein
MGKPFTVNVNRFDPYKSYRFLVYFGTSTSPVAVVSKVGTLKRSSEVIEYKSGGDGVIRKGLGLTQDQDFVTWANYSQVLDSGSPSQSLANLRKEVRIDLLNEEGQPVWRFLIHRCWVSEYQALPDLDAGANAVAIEHIKLENEGWEQDTTLTEPLET